MCPFFLFFLLNYNMATAVITPSHVAPSNYIPFREFDSVTKGFEACEIEGKLAVPFVVRASSLALSGINKGDVGGDDSSWPSLAKIRKQLRLEGYIEGYSCVNNEKISMSGADTLIAHDNCKLNHNIIDSISTRSSTSLLSEQMIKLNKTSRVEEQHWLAYVVSPVSNHIGALHCDPPFGSNWQFMAEGEKTWYAISPKEFDIKLFDCQGNAPDMKKLSLLHDTYKVTISPGDFVSVPIFWPHAIQTNIAAIGLSGYSIVPSALLSPRDENDDGDY